jgi:uncharacterized protein
MKHSAAKNPRIDTKAASYKLFVKRSPVHRYGVFALEDIPAGRRVIEYTGKRLSREQAWKIRAPADRYLVSLSAGQVLDGRFHGSGAQYINHSCDANLQWRRVKGRLLFFSRRKIRAGEELTVTYGYPVELERVPCRCGTPRCRGTLRFILH